MAKLERELGNCERRRKSISILVEIIWLKKIDNNFVIEKKIKANNKKKIQKQKSGSNGEADKGKDVEMQMMKVMEK